jgi:hypothetical protein
MRHFIYINYNHVNYIIKKFPFCNSTEKERGVSFAGFAVFCGVCFQLFSWKGSSEYFYGNGLKYYPQIPAITADRIVTP